MPRVKYEDDFKLEVVKAYLDSPTGVRMIARSYGLPSKNYIHKWLDELKEKGLIDPDVVKNNDKSSCDPAQVKSKGSAKQPRKTLREKQLEKEVLRLQAENAYLKKLKELERRGLFPKE